MSSRKSATSSTPALDGYEALDVIGSGTFGLIRKVRRLTDGEVFARKELNFERMTERDRKQIVAEVNILRTLQHDNIVRYVERFIDLDKGTIYIVMEYCEGGDLGSTIKTCRKNNQLLPEETVWDYFLQMTRALDACHWRDDNDQNHSIANGGTAHASGSSAAILHRDLKPENVFLDSAKNIKLGDFGLSKQVAAQSFACTYVGTPYYMSPELASGSPYDTKSDIWALGCIVYELCALAPPFDATSQPELTRKIKLGHVPELPKGYSQELGAVIKQMLSLDPRKRPSTKHLLQHPQIRNVARVRELEEVRRKLVAEKTALRAQWSELADRERLIVEREAALQHYEREQQLQQGQQSSSAAALAQLEERDQALREAAQQLERKEDDLERRDTELSSREQDVEHREREAEHRAQELEREREEIQRAWADLGRRNAGAAATQSSPGAGLSSSSATSARRRRANAIVEDAGLGASRAVRAGEATSTRSAWRSGVTSTEHTVVIAASRPSLGLGRPTARRTASGGRARLSAAGGSGSANTSSGDVSLEYVRTGVTLGTPRTIRERELRVRERLARKAQREEVEAEEEEEQGQDAEDDERKAPSENSDEWVDNDESPVLAEHFASSQGPTAAAPPELARSSRATEASSTSAWRARDSLRAARGSEAHGAPPSAPSTYRQSDEASGSSAASTTAPTATTTARTARRSNVYSMAARAARNWRTAGNGIADDSDVSMRSVQSERAGGSSSANVTMHLRSEDKENEAAAAAAPASGVLGRPRGMGRKSYSTPAIDLERDEEGGPDGKTPSPPIGNASRPALISRTTAATVTVPAPPPVYDLDDEDLPSPFLRKAVDRLPAKLTANGVSSAGGGASFLARAAAAGAARANGGQNMARRERESSPPNSFETRMKGGAPVAPAPSSCGGAAPGSGGGATSRLSGVGAPLGRLQRPRTSALPAFTVVPLQAGYKPAPATSARRSYIPAAGSRP